MTRTAPTTPTVPAGRDLTLDLARVFCVVLVVFVHILFTGVGIGPDGSLLIEKTVERQPWFSAATWVLNIMPLFFVVGGYAARAGWRSAVKKGLSADDFVRVRLARLARPALVVFVFFTVALAAVRMLGIDPALVDGIAIGVGSPLWFLAAYLVAQAFAPLLMRWHDRHGWRVLVAAARRVDRGHRAVRHHRWHLRRRCGARDRVRVRTGALRHSQCHVRLALRPAGRLLRL
ncbi:acyltransferase [Microbacterium sp.]|uniref:acyltransferase family protein n=1 Tax=Microbacterium sp. TaxID=51671 RepID=UPI0026267652|nr:acyltransferase [Microbacterium sp.]